MLKEKDVVVAKLAIKSLICAPSAMKVSVLNIQNLSVVPANNSLRSDKSYFCISFNKFQGD